MGVRRGRYETLVGSYVTFNILNKHSTVYCKMECCVCFDPTKSGLACNHPVCPVCIPRISSGKCPVCRAVMEPRNHPMSFRSCAEMVVSGNLRGLQLLFDADDLGKFDRHLLLGMVRDVHVRSWLLANLTHH